MFDWLLSISLAVVTAPPDGPPAPVSAPKSARSKLLPFTDRKGAAKPARDDRLPAGHMPLDQKRAEPPLHSRSDDELFERLADRAWVANSRPADNLLMPAPPWHHPALTALVQRCQADPSSAERIKTQLVGAFEQRRNPTLRFNAAVALAHLGDRRGAAELSRKLLEESSRLLGEEQHLAERTAAIDALALAPAQLNVQTLTQLRDRWFPTYSASKEPLAAGILWAIVRARLLEADFDPSRDPLFTAAATSPGVALRRVGAIAFASRQWSELPPPLVRLLGDQDALTRRTALAALAQRPTPAGEEATLRATSDTDITVRLTAIELLGKYPGTATKERLDRLLSSDSEGERAAAARAAGSLKLDQHLQRAAEDVSARVRTVAAESLGSSDDPAVLNTLTKLLGDRSADVEVAAVQSLGKRPAVEAAPLLLDALGSPALRTREAAIGVLALRWPRAATFDVMAPPGRREQALRELKEAWKSERGAVAKDSSPAISRLQDEQLSENVRRLLLTWHGPGAPARERLANELVALGPGIVPLIEQELKTRNSYPEPELLRRVLAPLDSTYRLLSELGAGDKRAETFQAAQLATQLERARLNPMQAAVIVELARRASGAGVWLSLVPLVERDQPDEASRLDHLGLKHPEARVRLACCERIARRAGSQHSETLAALFDDRNSNVRVAALSAAGRTGDPRLLPKLGAAMRTPDARVRVAAAGALARLGEHEGAKEISRLVGDQDPTIRRAAIREVLACSTKCLTQAERHRLLSCGLKDEKLEVRSEALHVLEELTDKSFAFDRSGQPVSMARQVASWTEFLDNEIARGRSAPAAPGAAN